ncbi:MAG: NUDIX domain-containing protein [Candidatus Pacebacteria bacterium]|jgi:ADP-ribose pyrophosphatase YjhB (NUDIX family)|nr:NUDIX domain-containing protein [Candidatus Paceibacterota bacterium]
MEMQNKKVICKDKDGNDYEIAAQQLKFRPSVYGVIVRDGKILLSRQWDGYDFPGGGVNLGERIEEALRREVWEETGFEVRPSGLLTCVDDFHKMTFDGTYVQSILVYYSCVITGGELTKENFDAAAREIDYMNLAEWVDLADIGKVRLYNPIRDVKAQILDNLKNGNQTC